MTWKPIDNENYALISKEGEGDQGDPQCDANKPTATLKSPVSKKQILPVVNLFY